MKKSGPDRKYTQEFRLAAVKQVIDGGRSTPQVAPPLEMSPGTLGNWVARRPLRRPYTDLRTFAISITQNAKSPTRWLG